MKKILLGAIVLVIVFFAAILQKFGVNQDALPVSNSNPNSTSNSTDNNSSSQKPNMMNSSSMMGSQYKNGEYTGSVADAFYGNYQVKAIITGGKLTDVQVLQYPSDAGHSIEVNSYANPILRQEAISSQNANVDIVSGATQSSLAFRQSLQSALNQAI